MNKILPALLLLFLAAACSKNPKEQYTSLQETAAQQLADYRFDQADSTFIRILFADSMRFDGPVGLALSQERQMLLWDAAALYAKLSERNPRLSEAALGAMRVYERLGLLENALERGGVALQLVGETDSGKTIIEVARLIAQSQQPYIARQLVPRAIKAGQPQAIGDMLTALAFAHENVFDSAGTYADKAMSQPPDRLEFDRVAADYYEYLGRLDSAMDFSRRQWQHDQTDFNAMIDHFLRSLRLGYFNDAREVLRYVDARGAATAPAYVLRLYYQRATRQDYEALTVNTLLIDLKRTSLTPFLMNIETRRRVSDFITCTAELNSLEAMLDRGNYVEPFVNFMKYRLVIISSFLDEKRIPAQQLQDQVAYRSTEREHRIREAVLLHNIGALDEFQAKMDTMKTLYADNPIWMTAAGSVYGDSTVALYKDAQEQYRKALALAPAYRPAFDGYIETFRLQKRPDEAVTAFTRYPQFAQNFADLRVVRAEFLARTGQNDQAVDSFLVSITPLSGCLWHWDQMIDLVAWNRATAAHGRLIEALVKALPDEADALTLAARYYENQDNYTRALEVIEHGLTVDPDHGDLMAHKAWNLYRTGRADEAFALFDAIEQSQPDNSEYLYFVSRALAESRRDPDRAMNQARRSLYSGPEVYRDWMNLCFVYMMSGRPDLARGEARRAEISFKDQPEIYYYQGYAQFVEGTDGAKKLLEKAVSLGLGGEDLNRAREALGKL
jgi:tetratricopeptide (TPR) repeat protein